MRRIVLAAVAAWALAGATTAAASETCDTSSPPGTGVPYERPLRATDQLDPDFGGSSARCAGRADSVVALTPPAPLPRGAAGRPPHAARAQWQGCEPLSLKALPASGTKRQS